MNTKTLTLLALLVPFVACGDSHDDVAEEIRGLVQRFNDAYAVNDLDTYFSFYAPDATLVFDQARTTVAQYKEEWHALIDAGGGLESIVMSDMQVRVLDDGQVAVATYLADNATRSPDGDVSVERLWETDVWEKRADGWKIVVLDFHYLAADE